MISFPSSESEFFALVPDEAAAERILAEIRWPDGVACGQCGSHAVTRLSTRPRWQCQVCRAQTSVRSGTVLHRTRVPLREWLYIAWACSTAAGPSARALATRLGRRYETVWVLLHKLRASLAERGTWQLCGHVFVGTGAFRITKRANGDPDLTTPAVAAFAVSEGPDEPEQDSLRIITSADPARADAALIRAAQATLVEWTAEVHVEPGRMAVGRRDLGDLARAHQAVARWLRTRFRGVSRRYLANYVAQFVYLWNRWPSGGRRFGWVIRRLASEPWRSRPNVALAVP